MPLTYDIGDQVRLQGVFASTDGTPANPTTVTFAYQSPTSTSIEVSTPSTEVANPTTGTFTYDILPMSTGVWRYRISSTGNLITAEESYFVVQSRLVT